MADDFPLQPVLSGGPSLQNPDYGVSSPGTLPALGKVAGTAFMDTTGAQGAETFNNASYGAVHGTDLTQPVPYDKAVAILKQGNYDASGVPKAGWTGAALMTEMQRQERDQDARLAASRANLSSTSQFVAGVAGGLGDPITLAAGPLLGRVSALAKVGAVGRAAVGGAEGAALVGGEEALQNHLEGHDEDSLSWTMLRDVTLSAAPGALLHSAFGARPAPRENVSDSFANAINFTMGQEGGTAVDTGGLTKFGISQNSHPGLDITKLTPADAASIYHNEYWKAIDGDNISDRRLAAVAFDAAVNQGASNAKKWLAESGGDVDKFLSLREEHYRSLAAADPSKYGKYLNGWLTRLTAFRVQMMGQLPRLGPTEVPMADRLPYLAHTGPEAGPHSDINDKMLNDEYMRRFGGATSPVPYSDEQMAVMRVMGGDSELVPPAFSDEYMNRFGGEKWPVLPRIEQRGPASPVDMGPLLNRLGQRWGATWEDRSNAGRLAVAQLQNDSPVDVKPVSEHEAPPIHTQNMQDAVPVTDKMFAQSSDTAREAMEATPQANPEIEAYNSAAQAAQERVSGLGPDAQQVFREQMAENEKTPEFGTLQHDDVTKGVQAAVQCGVMKGLQYGSD